MCSTPWRAERDTCCPAASPGFSNCALTLSSPATSSHSHRQLRKIKTLFESHSDLRAMFNGCLRICRSFHLNASDVLCAKVSFYFVYCSPFCAESESQLFNSLFPQTSLTVQCDRSALCEEYRNGKLRAELRP